MKIGDLVTTRSRNFVGVIIESREMFATRTADKGENTHCHYVYWSSPKVENNPAWVMQRDLVRAI